MKKETFLYIFVIAGAVFLAAGLANMEWLQWISKPLIMLALILYYLRAQKDFSYLNSKPVLEARFFSLAWYTLLLGQQQDEAFFLAGLIAFLLAYVGYSFALRQHRYLPGAGLYGTQQFRLALPIVLAGTGLYTVLYPHLGNLKGAVMAYTLVIVVMALQALFRYGYTNARSYWMVLAGAALFMTSDGVLAVNKFIAPVVFADLVIMSTYLAAQYLLVQGLMHHQRQA